MNQALLAITVCCVSGYAAAASAQSIEGAFQLGLGTSVLSYEKLSGTVDPAFGANYDLDRSITRYGFSNESGLQVEGGYGVTDSLLLGGIIAFGGSDTKLEPEGANDIDSSKFHVLLAPKLDYHFLAGQPFQPFVGGAIGLVVENNDEDNADTSLMGLGLLARVGGRWFLAPGFSLDPALQFGFQTLSGEVDYGATNYDASATGLSVGLSLGVSGWLK